MGLFIEQLATFGNDNAGLERTLRFFHAICLLLSTTTPLLLLLPIVFPQLQSHDASSEKGLPMTTILSVILHLQSRLNLTRRFIRLFRFVGSSNAAQDAMTSSSRAGGTLNSLDIITHSLLAIFGFLESVTLLDLLEIPGLSIFGPLRTTTLNLEAQRCWIVALVTGNIATALRLADRAALAPVPAHPDGFGNPINASSSSKPKPDAEATRDNEKTSLVVPDVEKEKQRKLSRDEFATESTMMRWRIVADTMDMVIPATALGWVKVDDSVVASSMLITTLITGYDVWQRCGQQVRAKRTEVVQKVKVQ